MYNNYNVKTLITQNKNALEGNMTKPKTVVFE